jgi:hypothetical protein
VSVGKGAGCCIPGFVLFDAEAGTGYMLLWRALLPLLLLLLVVWDHWFGTLPAVMQSCSNWCVDYGVLPTL